MPRSVERDLIPDLIAYRGYRQARRQAVILYGLAGSGKTAIARSLADNERIKNIFRDGIAWVDGSHDPEEEVTRLCQALNLERVPGERWLECWRRWASAAERRLLLIVDDAVSAEGLPPLIAGLGSQVAVLITTQQGAEIRAEVERWLPADAIMEVGAEGMAPIEGRAFVEVAVGRPLAVAERELVREIGERVGWHPEALRLAAIEGREIGWQGMLDELRAGRMPWPTLRRRLLGQIAELEAEQRGWLTLLNGGNEPGAWFDETDIARRWSVETAVARRRLMMLKRQGLVYEAGDPPRWRMTPAVLLAMGRDGQGNAG